LAQVIAKHMHVMHRSLGGMHAGGCSNLSSLSMCAAL